MKKIVIHLIGHSCAGKSTIQGKLEEKIKNVYSLCYDKTKRQLPDYNRDIHKPLIKNLMQGFFETICKNKLSIILINPIKNKKEYDYYKKIAKNFGYSFYSFQINSPKEVLLSRFRDRIKSVKAENKKISVMDEKLFLENLDKKYYTPDDTESFDSSCLSPEEIVKKILNILNKK